MGFGGSVLAMILSLKQNARPKRSVFEYPKDKKYSLKNHYELQYKKVSPEKLKSIKFRIQMQSKLSDRRKVLALLLIIIICSLVLIYVSLGYQDYVKENNERIVKEREERLEQQKVKEIAFKNQDIIFFIEAGKALFEKRDFSGAKKQYQIALNFDTNNIDANVGLVRIYVYNCIYNDDACYTAQYILNKKQMQFKGNKELEELNEILLAHQKKKP